MNDLETSLRSLDAAEPITDEQQRHAMTVLDRIVATEVSGHLRYRRLAVAAAAVVAAIAGALVVLPGTGSSAYGSWTSVPSPLNPDELTRIGSKCLDGLSMGRFDRTQARVALAERRGEYAVLLYRSADMVGSCFAHNVPGSDDVDHVTWGAASAGGSQFPPARRFTDGSLADFGGASVTEGVVGADVTGVTVHAKKLTAQATVTDGRYVVWWPGPAFEKKNGQPVDFLTYDLTLRDGTVIHDAEPSHG
ncbi:hypothetical protein [Actinoplanes sp. HUAS TT8]|uniref:hypothetical protein n=1 Tax=Actinoplanes sp. HUAS TT8 TaxID=3447453 RepID=UPI003F5247C3